jgi:RNA polymerase sigma-70 factor, ECF subfamily
MTTAVMPASPLTGAAALPHATPIAELERRRIEAVLAGDHQAFAALVGPHLPMLYRVAARGCGHTMAEDAVQDTLTIAFQKLSIYRPGTSLKSWLASIAAQRAWTSLRGEIRRRQREQAADVSEQPSTPEQNVRANQLAERVNSALAKLPEKRRLAATMRLDAGLSYTEIAEAIGSTEGSARVLVHMALKSLREELADVMDGTGPQANVAGRLK